MNESRLVSRSVKTVVKCVDSCLSGRPSLLHVKTYSWLAVDTNKFDSRNENQVARWSDDFEVVWFVLVGR